MRHAWILPALIALVPPAHAAEPADIVLTNARVFTGDPSRPWAEALAIDGRTLRAVGAADTVLAHAGPQTRRIDAGGRLVIPGINDAHVHMPYGTGETAVPLDIPPDATAEAILAVVAAAARRHPPGTLLTGQLSPQRMDSAPTRADLDRAAPQHPVRLAPPGGHSGLLNSKALAAWNIGEDVRHPPGGAYGRTDGRLDGWLHEHAYWLPQRRLAEAVPDARYLEQLAAFEEEALRHGITSVQAMPLISAARTERLLAGLPARLHWRVMDFRLAPFDDSPAPRPVKYILDGTPIERGAALRADYADAPGVRGRLNYTATDIAAMVARAATGSSQLLVHASGDAAVDALLQAMRAHGGVDWPRQRVRIEHGDGIAADQVALVRDFGIVVVQNPAHFTGAAAEARIGPERIAEYQKVRSLLAAGVPLALGSDGPLNPYLNMLFAARHRSPDEALSVEESLRAYTSGAAFAEFAEDRKGRLAPGMQADLAVLSQDITAVPPEALPATHSVLTIVAGRVALDALGSAEPAPAKRADASARAQPSVPSVSQ